MNDTAELLENAATTLRRANRIVIFTGAGVSAESGIPTFRDEDGLWARFPADEFASWPGLADKLTSEPHRVAQFVYELITPIAKAEPNPAHHAIAAMQEHKPVTVITQNIDALHQRAGSREVCEVHGSLYELVDFAGRVVKTLSREDIFEIGEILKPIMTGNTDFANLHDRLMPYIGEQFLRQYRPKIVLFGDSLSEPDWSNAVKATAVCDCMLAVGSSCQVYPAASLVHEARNRRTSIITVDPKTGSGDIWLKGDAGEIMPRLIEKACAP